MVIEAIDYTEEGFTEKILGSAEECAQYRQKSSMSWINVVGIHETNVVDKIGEIFGLHPLVLEDIVTISQRPKIDDFEEYLFVVLNMVGFEQKNGKIRVEQVSLVIGPGYVISFQEHPGDVFEPVRQRIRSGKGKIRKMGSDYLAYSLIDVVVDNYFVVLESLGEKIEQLEQRVVQNPGPSVLNTIYTLKHELLFLRKSLWPLREVVSSMTRGELKLVKKQTIFYLKDVYDHTIQVIDTLETFRDMTSGMLDVYLSSVSNRMNEVMKVLTVIATIFIPLTFITGVYGMNFEHMPELSIGWAYPVLWAVMLLIAVSMAFYFKRKAWI